MGSQRPPLRVCVVAVVAHGIGGMQRHTQDLVRGLVAAGHDVEVICPAAGELTPDLYGARWHLVDTMGRVDPHWRAKFRAAFVEATARAPFDVVHSESTAALGLMDVPGLPPVVVNYHGNYLGLAKAHLRRMATRPRTALREARTLYQITRLHLGHRNATAFRDCVSIVPSPQQADDTRHSHLIPRALMHVVPNGIDGAAFAPGSQPELRTALGIGDGTIVASVGRLAKDKGFDVAVEAFARLAADHPDVSLLVIGDGEEMDALRRQAERLGVAERVHLIGAQPPDRVPDYLRAADVFVFPTIRDEAFGLVLAEAMSAGLPIVASRIGAIPDILETPEGDAGLLVRAGSVDELEAGLRRLLDDTAARAEYAGRARRRFQAEYTLERMIERTVEVYRTAIARSAQTRVG